MIKKGNLLLVMVVIIGITISLLMAMQKNVKPNLGKKQSTRLVSNYLDKPKRVDLKIHKRLIPIKTTFQEFKNEKSK